ncbi:hypothetical protein QFC22_006062 [Naganishia vaughanmartiniae]|uniref:Uncharacterized protein n=1 Tax=Naganishia vaughanmartiniae TaxID=1424756 RepID=A0ACC2WP90_9TREE|nr:hypothetical protein QFC22_006062 [Naganishia vaughanmartiniae]
MMLDTQLAGNSVRLWSLLFLISHLFSTACAFRWPQVRLVVEIHNHNDLASNSDFTATPTTPISTVIAPTAVFSGTVGSPIGPATPVPSVGPTPTDACSVSFNGPTAVYATATASSHSPSTSVEAPARVLDDIPLPPMNQQYARMNSSERSMDERLIENLPHFVLSNTSFESSFEALFKVDRPPVVKFSSGPSVDKHNQFVSNFTLVDQKRLRIIASSQAHRYGSFVLGVGGWTIDMGFNRLPKYWSPILDPPLLNDLGNEWAAAIALKRKVIAKAEAEFHRYQTARLVYESEVVTYKQRSKQLLSSNAASKKKSGQIDRALKRAKAKESSADRKLREASKIYRRAVYYEFNKRHAHDTTNPTSALVLGLSLPILLYLLYIYAVEDEVPSPTAPSSPPPPPPYDDESNTIPEPSESSNSDIQQSSPDIEPRQEQTQGLGTQTVGADSPAVVTRDTRSSVQVVSESEPASAQSGEPVVPAQSVNTCGVVDAAEDEADAEEVDDLLSAL